MSKRKENKTSRAAGDSKSTTDEKATPDTPPEAAPVPLAPNEGGETSPEPFTSPD